MTSYSQKKSTNSGYIDDILDHWICQFHNLNKLSSKNFLERFNKKYISSINIYTNIYIYIYDKYFCTDKSQSDFFCKYVSRGWKILDKAFQNWKDLINIGYPLWSINKTMIVSLSKKRSVSVFLFFYFESVTYDIADKINPSGIDTLWYDWQNLYYTEVCNE